MKEEHHQPFEEIKQVDNEGAEYWSARELAKLLDYSEYRHFNPVLERAKDACLNSGHNIDDHFEDVLGMVKMGSGAQSYQGLYGGLDQKAIHQRKGLKKSQKILDHMGSTELGANRFRAPQAEKKLIRDQVNSKQQANQTHFDVGRKVRQTNEE